MKLIGKIKEAHGLRGEVYVLVFSGDVSWLPKLTSFGLGVLPARGEEPPADAVKSTLTCEKAKPFKKGLILKPKEFKDRNAAEAAQGQGFYVPAEFLQGDGEEDGNLAEILGFTVKDTANASLGEIVGFSSNGPQDLLVLKTAAGKEAEVPFVEAFLKKIDFKRKTVVMDLPEGLLDLDALGGERDGQDDEGDPGDDE